MIKNGKVLKLEVKTWLIDSHGIFDYSKNNNEIYYITTFIDENAYFSRTKKNRFEKQLNHCDIDFDNGEELLFYIEKGQGGTYKLINFVPKYNEISEKMNNNLNNKMWYRIKDFDSNISKNKDDYAINLNDIIKLGKMKYAVQKIYIKKNSKDETIINKDDAPQPINSIKYNIDNSNLPPVLNFVKKYKKEEYIDLNKKIEKNEKDSFVQCDICKEFINNENMEDNFLIKFCNCENKMTHYYCLKNKYINGGNSNNLLFTQFGCSDCNILYPVRFELEGFDKTFYLIDYTIPQNCNYMILESIDSIQDNKLSKLIHIIPLNKDIIKIGRDFDNDVLENDISVSRHHAIFRYNEATGKIFLENLSKKFGTLVLIRKPIEILEQTLDIQIGRTFVEACVVDKKEWEELKKMNEMYSKMNQITKDNTGK